MIYFKNYFDVEADDNIIQISKYKSLSYAKNKIYHFIYAKAIELVKIYNLIKDINFLVIVSVITFVWTRKDFSVKFKACNVYRS